MKIKLEVMSGAMDGEEFHLKRSFTIGREKSNEVPLNLDKYISRRHARVLLNGSGICVEDLGSTNGTFICGERVYEKVKVDENQLFRVGRTWVKLNWKK
ncbi:MAG: FHA domain-containing protein [Candidatus Eremiobacteraeota bacterium]|nr:FHA domain-containing protein [Candidatus Eremiobacteraeota bacterium]